MRPRLSLKGRALQWLAQREHSRLELRRKLMRQARAEALATRPQAAAITSASSDPRCVPGSEGAPTLPTRESMAAQVETLLDWLQAQRYLSEERFVESRVHARSSRFGNLRIRQELAQHGLAITPELSADLLRTECERATGVRQRKFGDSPATAPTERARQARFLAGRGFSPDVIWKVMRELGTVGSHDED
jgi:regulatory protein